MELIYGTVPYGTVTYRIITICGVVFCDSTVPYGTVRKQSPITSNWSLIKTILGDFLGGDAKVALKSEEIRRIGELHSFTDMEESGIALRGILEEIENPANR